MGTFRVEVTVRNLQDSGRTRTLSLPVDTGATYTTLPREVVEAVGCHPIGKRRVLLANGREEEWDKNFLRSASSVLTVAPPSWAR